MRRFLDMCYRLHLLRDGAVLLYVCYTSRRRFDSKRNRRFEFRFTTDIR